jgi:hypothetical protein
LSVDFLKPMLVSGESLLDFNARLEKSPAELPEQNIYQHGICRLECEKGCNFIGSLLVAEVVVREVCDLN